MTKELHIFTSAEFGTVRTVEKDGEPWFMASDVAKALGYEKPNNAINEHCKKVNKFSCPNLRQAQPYNIIPESDVYRLIMRSNLPSAERFQDWVVEEVLPAIRKHGVYATPATVESMLEDPDSMIRVLQSLKEERAARLEAERTKAEIGSRREATAMATASAAVRKVNILEARMGIAGEYHAVKALAWVPDVFNVTLKATYSQLGKYLKKLSLTLGYEVKQAPDSLHESVNLYHVDVIKEFRRQLMTHPELLAKYRHADKCWE